MQHPERLALYFRGCWCPDLRDGAIHAPYTSSTLGTLSIAIARAFTVTSP